MEQKFFSLLGLARKAGKVLLGYDNIIKKQNRIQLLIMSDDSADRTKKNVLLLKKPTIIIDMSKQEFGKLLGVGNVSVVAVTDNNFAEQLNLYAKKE